MNFNIISYKCFKYIFNFRIKQVEEQEARIKDYVHESSKPLARYEDDQDLENELKGRERIGDPMLEYMRKKEKEKGGGQGEKTES